MSIDATEVKNRIQKGNIDEIYYNNTCSCLLSKETMMGERKSHEQDKNNIEPTNVSDAEKVISF